MEMEDDGLCFKVGHVACTDGSKWYCASCGVRLEGIRDDL